MDKVQIPKLNYRFHQFFVYLMVLLVINVFMAFFLYSWVTDADFSGLPPKDKSKTFDSRLVALFYYNSITLSTLGYGDVVPISDRARMFVGIYVVLITAGLITALDVTL
jgi:hypothetical protein